MSPPGWLAKDHPGGLFHIYYRGISSRNTSRLISLRQKVALISIPSAKNPARSADELSIIPTFSHIHIRIRGDFPLRLFRRIPPQWVNGNCKRFGSGEAPFNSITKLFGGIFCEGHPY